MMKYVLVFHRMRPAKAAQSDSGLLCPPLSIVIQKPRISGVFSFLLDAGKGGAGNALTLLEAWDTASASVA
ncbi:hypothetical protein AC626_16950 [Pseudoalteromonas rubra]|uniref:Uncharacterized protein n=1 Tax=Pseudoalteromonas rubra TaxID=43658 RepID=A0A0L0EPX3_9GAMM|nr:hypothetical protein AC626_16950 [Pseudoalteromonas rubra]